MAMTGEKVYYDPYDVDIYADPYDVYRRLRDEAPLYYNDTHDFYAISRYDDVKVAFGDNERLLSGRGVALDQIKQGYQFPPGTLVNEDEPVHRPRRALLARVFTPKRMMALEPQVREYCAKIMEPLMEQGGFDAAKDIGNKVPMRVIGMLLGIPEEDQDALKLKLDAISYQEPGEKWEIDQEAFSGEIFADYIDWRVKNPSDDLMTQLLQAEFEDELGVTRRLTRAEILSYVNIIAAAGNETTGLLIGWSTKLLADHPDQRQKLREDPSLIQNAVEETLRFESSTQAAARYVNEDVELHGEVMPAGSAVLLLTGSANRDEREFDNPDVYDVSRIIKKHFAFSHGIHVCLGAALARLEGRIVIEEMLSRFPDWQVDHAGLDLGTTNVGVRGWRALPVTTR